MKSPTRSVVRSVTAGILACLGATAPFALTATSNGTELTSYELAIWNDPKFQRRFAESYMAETDIEPRVSRKERERMQDVLELISANDLGEAAALLEKQRDESSSAVFDFTLANIYFQREQLEPAARAYSVAVDKFPKFRRAWRNLGLIRVRQNNHDAAIPALTRVIELGGGDAIMYGLLGFSYASVGNSLSAESAYRTAILLDPETMDWKMGLARSLFRQERFEDAAALCGQLIANDPDRTDLWLLQANAYIGLGKPQKAAENYELVDRLGGSTADSLNMLGDIYVNDGLFDLAVKSYVRSIELAPAETPERALRAARVMAGRGALWETRLLLERLEALDSNVLSEKQRKDILKLRARIAVAEGAGGEEARILEEIVALDPLDGEALILLGQHYGRAGEVEKAVFRFEQAAGVEGFEVDAKIRHAQLLVGQGRYGDALPLLRRAQDLEPRENVQGYLEQVERIAGAR